MKHIQAPFQYGKLTLPSNVFYAPLAGCSDFPFRQMSAHYKPGLMFCEMVKMEALVRKVPETYRMLAFSSDMHPIGGQICGSKPQLAGESAKIIEDLGFDVVDLNCGCPVDKVTKDGSGSGMLKQPELIGEIIANMVAAVNIPVTVKIRVGWDEKHIIAKEVTQIAEQAGATAITIHGRTRQQGYKGPANWDHIRDCKQVAKRIKVVGNGDIMNPQSAFQIFEHTGCDAILVARGTLGHPWIIQDILQLNKGMGPSTRTLEDYRQALLQHLEYSLAFKSERGALIDMRRVCCWYLKSVSGAREFRGKASHAQSLQEVTELIKNLELKPLQHRENEEDEHADMGATCDF